MENPFLRKKDRCTKNTPVQASALVMSSHIFFPNCPINVLYCFVDVLCLALFLVFLGAWGFVAYMGIKDGDIEQVIYPTDSKVLCLEFL